VRYVDKPPEVDKGLPKWATVFILVAATAIVLAIFLCVFYLCRSMKRRDAGKVADKEIITKVEDATIVSETPIRVNMTDHN
jgi:hypothetical protein